MKLSEKARNLLNQIDSSDEDVNGLVQYAITSGLAEMKKLAGIYLPGGTLGDVSPSIQQELPPCPPTNDHLESGFGRAKYYLRSHPNANYNTMKGLLQFDSNKTADDLEALKKEVPDLISKSMKEQRRARKLFTKKQLMKEIGQKKEQIFLKVKAKKDEAKRKKEEEIARLQQIKPWDWHFYCAQREEAKLGDLREQLQIRKKVLFPNLSKESWALNINKQPRDLLQRNLEKLLAKEQETQQSSKDKMQSTVPAEEAVHTLAPSIIENDSEAEDEMVKIRPHLPLTFQGYPAKENEKGEIP
jgi:hypothetical protein